MIAMTKETPILTNYEQCEALRSAGNAQAVLRNLHHSDEFEGEWDDNADIILEHVEKHGKDFAPSVARKARKYKRMSEKQAWVVAFAFVMISIPVVASIDDLS